MDRIRIVGGNGLNGVIPISAAKNAALPLMIAALLTEKLKACGAAIERISD
jgi:UDP-N-acetylglucosamine 1-carboxyvinyltransferase